MNTNSFEPRYTDIDLMPFGKFKGKPLSEVPASYLHWFFTKGEEVKGTASEKLMNYIRYSLVALKDENPDLIWKR